METTVLGRTGLEVSVAGLGCGGHSRLGIANGHDQAHASKIVKSALDLGINFIDTSRAYGTEGAVGDAIRGVRDKIVLSTKALVGWGNELFAADAVVESLETSLAELKTDYIDVFNLHGVTADQYPYCVKEILPALVEQQARGKIRFLGITEKFNSEPSHAMLKLALSDDHFDVLMVGFNLLNPSARKTVLPLATRHNVATQIMFAVRRGLSNPAALGEVISQLLDSGQISASMVDVDSPLGFVEQNSEVSNIVQAAYRFCRHEPGVTVTLTGTGNEEHLKENVASILASPLPLQLVERLNEIFGDVDSVTGE